MYQAGLNIEVQKQQKFLLSVDAVLFGTSADVQKQQKFLLSVDITMREGEKRPKTTKISTERR